MLLLLRLRYVSLLRTWEMQKVFYSNNLSERPTVENHESLRSRWEEKSKIDLNHFAQDGGKWPVSDIVCHVHVITSYES
jgi:hypothetical protein